MITTATPVGKLGVAKGFKVELLYSVPKDKEGSWVSMCTDPKGRLIVSDQYGGLFRVTPPKIGGNVTISGNSGTGPLLPDDATPEVEANKIGGHLDCSGNSGVTNDAQPNTVGSPPTGQCAGL